MDALVPQRPPLGRRKAMRVLVFGDSITQGYWDSGGGWVERLRRYYDGLQIKDLKGRDEPTVFNLGVSADTSSEILVRIEAENTARQRPEQVVVVQIGINDAAQTDSKAFIEIETYQSNLKAIAEKMQAAGARLIFVGLSAVNEHETTPVFWDAVYYRNELIQQYEKTMEQVSRDCKIPFFPIFDDFKKQLDAGEDLLADGLHPNDAGHKLIYELMRPRLDKIL
jgi:lysophospholipase L1-like esterase